MIYTPGVAALDGTNCGVRSFTNKRGGRILLLRLIVCFETTIPNYLSNFLDRLLAQRDRLPIRFD